MIKKIVLILLVASGIIVTVNSCDKIDAPYVITNDDTTITCDAPVFPALTSSFKRVLIEEYTGHKCPNCPEGGKIVHDLLDSYKDTLIAVAVHAGSFAAFNADDETWYYNFTTLSGDYWLTQFPIESFPQGMVDRTLYSGKINLAKEAWAPAVKAAATHPLVADVQIINEFDASKGQLCTHSKTTFLSDYAGRNINLLVLITEDSIIQPQYNVKASIGPTPIIYDYVHNHVLRGTVNGNWGVSVRKAVSSVNEPVIKSFGVKFTGFNVNEMNPENCHVVAILFDIDSKEVLQVTEKAVVE